ncbi:MAG: ABC transporter permease, partial [Acidobacteriaceae bacterium]
QRKQECREARGVHWLGDFGRDVQYGVRTMVRAPGFTVAALLILALGIGANTAIFSADHAVLFRSLPYRDPDRLVEVLQKAVDDPGADRMLVAPGNYQDWRADTRAFDAWAAWQISSLNLSGGDHPERVRAAQVSANLFDVLGAEPMLGRSFGSEEETPGRENAAILSYELWQRRFGGNPDVVGKTMRANDQVYTIAGVMPPGFRFPIGWISTDVELWTPLALSDAQKASRKDMTLEAIARLRPGVTVGQAQARLASVALHLAQAYPETNRNWTVNVIPFGDRGVSDFRELFVLLSMAVTLVLLIECANVANLLLARGMERQKELTVRTALGARRGRLVRQLMTEGVLLSLAGGLLGIGLGYAGVRTLASLAPREQLPDEAGSARSAGFGAVVGSVAADGISVQHSSGADVVRSLAERNAAGRRTGRHGNGARASFEDGAGDRGGRADAGVAAVRRGCAEHVSDVYEDRSGVRPAPCADHAHGSAEGEVRAAAGPGGVLRSRH